MFAYYVTESELKKLAAGKTSVKRLIDPSKCIITCTTGEDVLNTLESDSTDPEPSLSLPKGVTKRDLIYRMVDSYGYNYDYQYDLDDLTNGIEHELGKMKQEREAPKTT
jgi:hypothetical protein